MAKTAVQGPMERECKCWEFAGTSGTAPRRPKKATGRPMTNDDDNGKKQLFRKYWSNLPDGRL